MGVSPAFSGRAAVSPGITHKPTDAALDQLAADGYDPVYGGSPAEAPDPLADPKLTGPAHNQRRTRAGRLRGGRCERGSVHDFQDVGGQSGSLEQPCHCCGSTAQTDGVVAIMRIMSRPTLFASATMRVDVRSQFANNLFET